MHTQNCTSTFRIDRQTRQTAKPHRVRNANRRPQRPPRAVSPLARLSTISQTATHSSHPPYSSHSSHPDPFAVPLLKSDMLQKRCAIPTWCVPNQFRHPRSTQCPTRRHRSGETPPESVRTHPSIRPTPALVQPAGAASDFCSSAPASAPSAAGSAFAGSAAAAGAAPAAPAGPAPRPAFKASS